MTNRQLAKMLSISEPSFYELRAKGMPTDSFESASEWCKKNLNTRSKINKKIEVATNVIDYHEARRMREVAEAKIAELKLAEIDGTLIEKETVRIVVFEILRSLRDTLTSMSRRVSAAVAVADDAGECERLIKSEIDRALESVVTELKQKKIH
jgi:hypothetical protein